MTNTALRSGERIRYRRSAFSTVYSGTVIAYSSTAEGDGPTCALVRCDDGGTHHVPADTVLSAEEWVLTSAQRKGVLLTFKAATREEADATVAAYAQSIGKRRIPAHWRAYPAADVPDAS
jgi:hypothetical protein